MISNYDRLMKLDLYSWYLYICCFKDPVVGVHVLCFALIRCVSHPMCYACIKVCLEKGCLMICVLSKSLITPSSIDYTNYFAHAQYIWLALIFMRNKSSTCAMSNFAHELNKKFTGILVIKNISIHRNISIYQYSRCLHEIQLSDWAKK